MVVNKRTVVTLAALVVGAALAQGPATPKAQAAPPAKGETRQVWREGRAGSPQLGVLAKALGMEPKALQKALREAGGLPALLEKRGLSITELRERVIELRLEQLSEAMRQGLLPKAKAEVETRRLRAALLRLKTPSLAEILKRSGGDLQVAKAQLVAVWSGIIDQEVRLGLIAPQKAERLKKAIEARAQAFFKRPVGELGQERPGKKRFQARRGPHAPKRPGPRERLPEHPRR